MPPQVSNPWVSQGLERSHTAVDDPCQGARLQGKGVYLLLQAGLPAQLVRKAGSAWEKGGCACSSWSELAEVSPGSALCPQDRPCVPGSAMVSAGSALSHA